MTMMMMVMMVMMMMMMMMMRVNADACYARTAAQCQGSHSSDYKLLTGLCPKKVILDTEQ